MALFDFIVNQNPNLLISELKSFDLDFRLDNYFQNQKINITNVSETGGSIRSISSQEVQVWKMGPALI